MTATEAAKIIEAKIVEYGDIDTSVWSKKGVRVYLSTTKKNKEIDHGFIEVVGGEGLAAISLRNLTKYQASMEMLLKPAFEGVSVEAPVQVDVVRRPTCIECGSVIYGDLCTQCGGC
jgi:hypothetical protein